jgi:SAM-dependent methyltransferase
MHLDVVDLRAFYYRTRLGRTAQRHLQAVLRGIWPDTSGLTVAGFGFAAPFLRPFLGDARRVVCLMPAPQGVMPWPPGEPNCSVLVEETLWPVGAGFIDRMIVAHGLETCDRPDALLQEIWRTLAPGGRAMFIIPNRSGTWARRDATPFGHGRPYSTGQVEKLLRRHNFLVESHASALFAPASGHRFWLRTSGFWERLGRRFDASLLAGALIVEASKQVYAAPKSGSKVSVRGPLQVLGDLAGPVPEPARWQGRDACSPRPALRPDGRGSRKAG